MSGDELDQTLRDETVDRDAIGAGGVDPTRTAAGVSEVEDTLRDDTVAGDSVGEAPGGALEVDRTLRDETVEQDAAGRSGAASMVDAEDEPAPTPAGPRPTGDDVAEAASEPSAASSAAASGARLAPETPARALAVPGRKPRPWYWPRGSRRAQRWAALLVLLSVAAVGWLALSTYRQVVSYPERPLPGDSGEIVFEVPPGSSFAGVLELLVEHEVVPADEATYFKLFVLQQGAAGKTTAGEHRFRGDMTPTEVLTELQRRQPVREVRVTIPEGKHILEVAQILADAGLSDRDELEAKMRDPAFLRELGIEGPTAEGYLFPDTYQFDRESTADQIIRRLVERHRQVFAEVRRRHRAAAKELEEELGWGDPEVVILASLVEKETAVPSERPLIAGVFLNRMRFSTFQPKKLQTDPTIVYGCTVPLEKSAACEKFEGRIRTIHLRDKDNPYSTYAIEGLPPGPIANPGRAALEAALAPTKSRYLYFVAKGDGTHYFSKTEQEHERMVDKYIRGKG